MISNKIEGMRKAAYVHYFDGLPHVTSSKLLDILNDSAKYRRLKKLAITIDAMEPFAKATYALEGDGAPAVITYELVRMLYSGISTDHYPKVNAVAKQLSTGDATRDQLVGYAKACLQPAYQYFQSKFDNDLKPFLLAFKAACYFSPSDIRVETIHCRYRPAVYIHISYMETHQNMKNFIVSNLYGLSR